MTSAPTSAWRPGDLIDCSPPADEQLAVWPGDTPLSREILSRRSAGDPVTLSTLHATVHLGSHADSWSHIVDGSPSIDQMPLDAYLGPCLVLRVDVPAGRSVTVSDVAAVVPADGADLPARVLLATGTHRYVTDFSIGVARACASVAPDLVDWLADRDVMLVGIDTPSIDPFDSIELPAHHRCVERRVAILEGLVLGHVPAGRYELSAAPLALVGFDGSPVRAVLRVT